jgi:hypothetical protein
MRRKHAAQDALRRQVELSGLHFAETWPLSSQLWALQRGMTQAQVDADERWLADWRERRDRLQVEASTRDIEREQEWENEDVLDCP